MPTRVFFSFDFPDDLWRASVVRNRWVMDPGLHAWGFWGKEFTDTPLSPAALEAFVDERVSGAHVTAVLIGTRTAYCEHVAYAIRRSVDLGRGLLAIHIDKCKDRFGTTSARGPSPFDPIVIDREGELLQLASIVPTYDWIDDDGFTHLHRWVEEAMARPVVRR